MTFNRSPNITNFGLSRNWSQRPKAFSLIFLVQFLRLEKLDTICSKNLGTVPSAAVDRTTVYFISNCRFLETRHMSCEVFFFDGSCPAFL